jgi:hypothetical protein
MLTDTWTPTVAGLAGAELVGAALEEELPPDVVALVEPDDPRLDGVPLVLDVHADATSAVTSSAPATAPSGRRRRMGEKIMRSKICDAFKSESTPFQGGPSSTIAARAATARWWR